MGAAAMPVSKDPPFFRAKRSNGNSLPMDNNNLFPPRRKIPRSSNCYRGYYPSIAMSDHLRYESRAVEKKLYRFFDFLFVLGLVKSIHSQPFEIEYSPGHFYHPDLLVLFRFKWLKPWLIEGKGAYFTNKHLQELKPKFRAAIGFARKEGYIFHLVTDVQLSLVDDHILPFLKTHRGREVPSTDRAAVLEVLNRFGPMSPGNVSEICTKMFHTDILPEVVWRLAANGEIFCDLSKPFSKTVVAAPVPLNILYLNKNTLFGLPFSLMEGRNDSISRR